MVTTQAPHLYLLPGLLCDAQLWQHQAQALAATAQVSVANLTGAESIEALAEHALAHAPAEQFALAGLSMGGYVALEIMRQAPERVLALALLDTSARADSAAASEQRERAMQLAETDFNLVIRDLLHKLVHPSQLADPALMALIAGMARNLGKDVFVRQQRAIRGRCDSRPQLAAIHCPTLVLCGREDVITPIPLHEELHAGIVGSRLVIVENCGHLSPLSQPQLVSKALGQWLARAYPVEAAASERQLVAASA